MTPTRVLTAGILTAVLVTAGCSGDDEAPSESPARTETSDQPDDGNGALDGSEDDGG